MRQIDRDQARYDGPRAPAAAGNAEVIAARQARGPSRIAPPQAVEPE